VEDSPAGSGLAGAFRKILLEKQSGSTHEKIKDFLVKTHE